MSARQTEAGRSPGAVCGADGVGVDSDANGSVLTATRGGGSGV
jgi:hypothetical protein